MDKEKILNEIEKKFKEIKEELKFNSTFEEIDKIFFIRDLILKDGFVSETFSRQMCYRIIETFMSWNEYLHSIIMPNPQNILNISESKIFNQEEKKEITELIKRIMEINSRNTLIGLTKDKKAEGKLIDDSVKFWKEKFAPEIIKVIKKVNEEWGKTK